jgi:hypothetical protein
MTPLIGGEAVFRGAVLAFVAVAVVGASVALGAGLLDWIDARTVAFVALLSATVACLATIAYFLYLVLSIRGKMNP